MTMKLQSSPVELKGDHHPRIRLRPMYFELGFSKDPRVFVQEEVRDRLIRAVEILPGAYGIVIWDAYRSREVQGIMFEWMKRQVEERNPSLSEDAVFEETKKYMSPPSRVGDDHVPPHLSGGAVDLTLFKMETGEEVNLGTPFDDCSELAHALYYEDLPDCDANQARIRDDRRILRAAMTDAGFLAYKYEWWHFDYGNVFWSETTGRPQLFGPLFGDKDYPEE